MCNTNRTTVAVITVERGNDLVFDGYPNERGEFRERMWFASWTGNNGIRRTHGRTPFTALLRAARAARAELAGATA